MRWTFFLREAIRALTRNAVPSFAAMATILVTVLVLGVFIPVVQATTGAANEVRARVIADVYLVPRVSDRDVERVRRIIESDTPHVARVEYVSKEAAYREEKRRNPEAYDLLGSNPLPDTFRVYPDKPDNIGKVRNALSPLSPSGGRTVIDPAIDEVRNREEDTNKILSATRVVKLTMGLLAVLLCVASLLLIANTIRLSLYARRREVEVMKLVGATDWFIRWPFVLEGVLVGALGGVLAVLLLGVVKIALVDPLAGAVRAHRRARDDELRAADRGPAGRLGRRLRAGLRAVAAALPAGLSLIRAKQARSTVFAVRRQRYFSPLLLLLLSLVLALLIGGIWLGGHPQYLPGPVRDALVSDDDAPLYDEAMDVIAADYYRSVDRNQLLDASLGSAVGSLHDRFSNYFTAKDYRTFQETTEGRFEGVGMTVEEVPAGLRVLTVFKGSPAARGGLHPGETITAVNGRSIKGKSSEQATTQIKGRAGTTVRLTVLSGKRSRDIRLERAHVDVPVVDSKMVDSGGVKIAHVSLASFTSGAHGEVGQAVRRLLKRAPRGSCSTCATTAAGCSTRRCWSPRSSSPTARS